MAIKLTTVSTDVTINDLGARTFAHPTVDYDLVGSGEFTEEEIKASSDIQAAVTGNQIVLKDGNDNIITTVNVAGPHNHEEDSIVFSGTGHDHSGTTKGNKIDYTDLENVPSTFAPTAHGSAAHSGDIGAASQVTNDSSVGGEKVKEALETLNSAISSVESGMVRRKAVIDYVNCTAAPPTEVSGDRYILDNTVGTVHADWDGAAKLDIVQFNGTSWVATIPLEGWTAYVDLQNKDALYVDDGTPVWQLRPIAVTDHGDLSGVTANQHHNRQHALDSSSDHSALSDVTNFNASASAHGFLPKLSNQATDFLNGQGSWTTPSGSIFGSQFLQNSSEGVSSTSSTNYQQKLRLTTPNLPSGNYLIYWYCEFYDNYGDVSGSIRVQINDSDTICEVFNYDDYTFDYRPASGFYYAGSISGVKNIDLDYKSGAFPSALYIRRARLMLYRVS